MFSSSKTLKLFQKRLFQLLVFFLPTQLALHLWPGWAFIFGIRVDYLSPAIYLTDLFLLALLATWVFTKRSVKEVGLKKGKIFSIAFVLLFLVANISLSQSPEPAIYKWVKLFAFSCLSLFVIRKKGFNENEWVLKPLRYSLIPFSLIGLIQFFMQRTIGGPLYFLGERSFTSLTPGISLIDLFGNEYLRAYSTFSHPNSFGAFLAVSLVLLYFGKLRLRRLDYFVIGTSLLALLLTFSRAAILTFVVLVIIKMAGVKWRFEDKLFSLVLVLSILLSLALPVLSERLLANYDFQESIAKRLSLARASGELFTDRPGTGVGLNNFIVKLRETSISPRYLWELQPTHNIFLLALVEAGIVGLVVLFLVFRKSLLESSLEQKYALTCVIITGLVDHHWLTLQQNILLLFVVIGLSLRTKRGS